MSGPLKRVIPGCRHLMRQRLGLNSVANRSFFMRPGGHWDPFSDVQTSVRDMERSFRRMEQEMDQLWSNRGLSRFFPTFARRIPVQMAGQDAHRIDLDLSGYKPEDVKITLKDREVTIDAKMETSGQDGSRFYQELSRKFTLPEDVDVDSLKSLYSAADGILTIEAPFKNPPKIGNGPTEIPVNRIASESEAKQN